MRPASAEASLMKTIGVPRPASPESAADPDSTRLTISERGDAPKRDSARVARAALRVCSVLAGERDRDRPSEPRPPGRGHDRHDDEHHDEKLAVRETEHSSVNLTRRARVE